LTADPGHGSPAELDRSIARLLTYGTYGSVALLAVGVALMFVAGIPPRAGGPPFQPERVVDDLLHGRPAGVMWLGLIAVVATPAARVLAALVAFTRLGERTMAIVSLLILAVIAMSVILARGLQG
jgi:uncharacterized membrane protein